ncbi:MAG: CatB-related O-acetyltransferase [Mangrovicoccus sp.]
MPADFIDAATRHPLTLPNGEVYTNTVHLPAVIDHPNIQVGTGSYYNDFEPVSDYAARIAPYLHPGAPEKLIIGRYCQFAHGVRIVTSSANHPLGWFTTYPFAVFDPAQMPFFADEFAKGEDTVIGHDVWLGHGAMVLPGTHIGNGVIAGAGAVLRGEIPAWSVVVGNPGRVIRRRFDDKTCALLDRLAWWDLPGDEIRRLMPVLTSADYNALEEAVTELRGPVSEWEN